MQTVDPAVKVKLFVHKGNTHQQHMSAHMSQSRLTSCFLLSTFVLQDLESTKKQKSWFVTALLSRNMPAFVRDLTFLQDDIIRQGLLKVYKSQHKN